MYQAAVLRPVHIPVAPPPAVHHLRKVIIVAASLMILSLKDAKTALAPADSIGTAVNVWPEDIRHILAAVTTPPI